MTEVVHYVADDGKVFLTEEECRQYEKNLSVDILKDYIWFFNHNLIPINAQEIGRAEFCKVLKPVDEWSDKALEVWGKVMDSELDETICDYDVGWYICDECDRWRYWAIVENEFYTLDRALDRLKTEYED